MNFNETLRLKLHQGFPDRNPADAELNGQSLLAELESGLEFSIHDTPAQLLSHGGGDRPVLEGLPKGLWCCCSSVRHRTHAVRGHSRA
jgi:hypothetical protein